MQTTSVELVAAIVAGDESRAGELLDRFPDAATGGGAGGESPLLQAVYRGYTSLAERIARLRTIDACEAAAVGDAARLAARLEQSPDAASERSADGWTPLHLAAFFGHTECAERLVDGGADLEAPSSNSTSNTPLCAALAGRTDRALVDMLVRRGANVNARAAHGVTPLHLAASRGATEIVEMLLAKGAKATATMDDGRTPAALAAERGFPELSRRLESEG